MKFNISIPDELFEVYVKNYGLPAAYGRMRTALELCKDIQASDRVVILSGDNRRAIEAVFQTTIDSATKLVKLVQNMSTVSIGNVNVEFSEDQLQRLKAQAGFYGRTLEQYIIEQAQEIKAAMLEKV
jgi:hypothetical protein